MPPSNRLGVTAEEQCQCYQSLRLEDGGSLFILSKQLLYVMRHWLLPEGCDMDGIIEQVAMGGGTVGGGEMRARGYSHISIDDCGNYTCGQKAWF